MTPTHEDLTALAAEVENPPDFDIGTMDSLCRELHEIDPHSNVNGSCGNYIRDLYDAERLIPPDHLYSICHDQNEVRAVVAIILTERVGGFSAISHGPFAEIRALVAAALRAMATQSEGRG